MQFILKIIFISILYASNNFLIAKDSLYKEAEKHLNKGLKEKASSLFYDFYLKNKTHKKAAVALYRSAILSKNKQAIFMLEKLWVEYPNFFYIDRVLDLCGSYYFLNKNYLKAKYYYQQIMHLKNPSILYDKAFFYQVKIAALYEYEIFEISFVKKILDFFFDRKKNYYYQQLRRILAYQYFRNKQYQNALNVYSLHKNYTNFKEDIYLVFHITYYLKMWDLTWYYAIILFRDYPNTKEFKKIKELFSWMYTNDKRLTNELNLFYADEFKAYLDQEYLFFQFGSFENKANAMKYYSTLIGRFPFSFFILKKEDNQKEIYKIFLGPILSRKEQDYFQKLFLKEDQKFLEKRMQFNFWQFIL